MTEDAHPLSTTSAERDKETDFTEPGLAEPLAERDFRAFVKSAAALLAKLEAGG